MAEVQKHGFVFEEWVKEIFKVAHLASKSFILIVGRWEQIEKRKKFISIDEVKVTPAILKKMKGNISLNEIIKFDKKIRSFPAGKKGQQLGSKFAAQWKAERKHRMGLLNISAKLDSKNQRRIQCNLNYKNYRQIFGEPCMKTVLRNKKFTVEMNHGPRIFKKKSNLNLKA